VFQKKLNLWVVNKYIIMEKIKMIINHPLSKGIGCGIIGSMLLLEGHMMYSGIAFGVGLREILYAFKS